MTRGHICDIYGLADDSIVRINAACSVIMNIHVSRMRKHLYHQDIGLRNLAHNFDEDTLVVNLGFESAPEYECTSKVRIGAGVFMARQVLDAQGRYIHKIYHDLESLFYVLVWREVGYRSNIPPTSRDWNPPIKWTAGEASDMLKAKNNFISSKEALKSTSGVSYNTIRGRVKGIWDAYHTAMHDGSPELSPEEKRKRARAVAVEVVAKGGSQKDGKMAYFDEYARLSGDSTIIDGLGITFKAWMKAAAVEVGDEHSGCDCCYYY